MGGLCPSMHHRSHDQGSLCPGGSLSGGGALLGGSLSGGGSVSRRGLCPGEVSVRETLRMVMIGRYASYWNAFLC